MNGENTCWNRSVAGVCIHNGKVLLARHTYGGGKGMLIIPGGYINNDEMPEAALKREYREEVDLEIAVKELIGMRFQVNDWYAVFRVEYISGNAHPDNDENDEVVWLPLSEVDGHDDIPDLTKKLIAIAKSGNGFYEIPYNGRATPRCLMGAEK